jgi:hypothetical protein
MLAFIADMRSTTLLGACFFAAATGIAVVAIHYGARRRS